MDKQWKHGRRRSSITRNNIALWKKCDLARFQIKSQNFQANPNQITRFPNEIIMCDSVMI